MKIAITGASGHVGINLCKALIDLGHEINALTHKHDSRLKETKVHCIKGDMLEKSSLHPLVLGCDIVIHLAAKISINGDPDGTGRLINVEGTRNILEVSQLAGVKKFIHFSSIHAFEQVSSTEVLDERNPLVGDEAFSYDRSKAEGERLVMEAAKQGFNALVLCPTAIIGPVDYEPSLIGKAMLQLFNHEVPALVPGGYNWVDVRDIVQGCIAAIDKGRKGEKYLLSGEWKSLKEITTLITRITGINTDRIEMPFWLARVGLPFITLYSKITGTEPLYTSESLHIIKFGTRKISNEKARKELGYNPRELEITLTDLFQWFKSNNIINY
ncbi:MAG: NAD-dependent epimerase/dehydratase family protein [Bacteroidota bacterium]